MLCNGWPASRSCPGATKNSCEQLQASDRAPRQSWPRGQWVAPEQWVVPGSCEQALRLCIIKSLTHKSGHLVYYNWTFLNTSVHFLIDICACFGFQVTNYGRCIQSYSEREVAALKSPIISLYRKIKKLWKGGGHSGLLIKTNFIGCSSRGDQKSWTDFLVPGKNCANDLATLATFLRERGVKLRD